jgi:hypothetical protein
MSFLGSHIMDLFSPSNSEVLTIGNTSNTTRVRMYDSNNTNKGYFLHVNNGVFGINAISTPTNVGIGTLTPNTNATLQVQGTLLASNIGTYTGNTIFFNNQSLSGISNMTVTGNFNAVTQPANASNTLVATTAFVANATSNVAGTNITTLSNLSYIGSSGVTTTIPNLITSNLTVSSSAIISNPAGYVVFGQISSVGNALTATAGTSNTQIATTAFVQVASSNLLTRNNTWSGATNNFTGNVGIGSAAPAFKLDVNGDIRATGDITAYSDRRVKTDLRVIEHALDKVRSLTGYTFQTQTQRRSAGLIAQDVQNILPEVVHEDHEGYLSLAYGNTISLLVEAIKELATGYEQLRDELKK